MFQIKRKSRCWNSLSETVLLIFPSFSTYSMCDDLLPMDWGDGPTLSECLKEVDGDGKSGVSFVSMFWLGRWEEGEKLVVVSNKGAWEFGLSLFWPWSWWPPNLASIDSVSCSNGGEKGTNLAKALLSQLLFLSLWWPVVAESSMISLSHLQPRQQWILEVLFLFLRQQSPNTKIDN